MSANKFLTALDNDADLRAKVQAASDEARDKIIAVAKAHGYEVTAADLREAMHDKWDGNVGFHRTSEDEADDPSTCFVPISERPSK